MWLKSSSPSSITGFLVLYIIVLFWAITVSYASGSLRTFFRFLELRVFEIRFRYSLGLFYFKSLADLTLLLETDLETDLLRT